MAGIKEDCCIMNKKRRMFIRMIAASLVRRRSRMVVALLAIIVGATILAGLGMIYYDVPRQMSAQFRSYGANIIFMPSEGTFISDDAIMSAISVIPSSELEGYTPYRYENTSIHNIPVTLAGIDFTSVQKTSPYWHIEGEYPSSDGEVLLGAKVALSLGVKTGDKISALNSFEVTDNMDVSAVPEYEMYKDPATGDVYCDHQLDLTVSGIVETGGSEEEYAYISLNDIEYLTLVKRGYDIVEVSVASTSDNLSQYVTKINSDGQLSAKLIKRVTASETEVLTKLQSLVFIVTAVVLILTMICVATTMTAVIAERRREIGLRKALGADNSSIIGEFMSEGIVLGGIGGILGAVLGYVFAQLVSINVFGSGITFRPLLIPITIVVSVIVTGAACLIPIRNAVNVDPALVLKGE